MIHPAKNTTAITVSKIQEILQSVAIYEPIRDFQIIASGMLNIVIRVIFDNRRPDAIIRLRQFHHEEYGQEFAAERFVYPLIASKPVNVPGLIHFNAGQRENKDVFAIFEYVPGRLFTERMTDRTISKKIKSKLLGTIARALAAIHEVKNLGYGTHTAILYPARQRRDFFAELFLRELIRLKERHINFASDYEKIVPVWLDIIDILPDHVGAPTLLHGDIHGRNLIVTPNDEIFFIDWEASRFRIAPYDLAQIRYINFRGDREASDFFINRYLEALPETVDAELMKKAIDVCQYFWQCRMGLFLLQFPQFETSYFGTAQEHLQCVKEAVQNTRN